MSVQQRLFFSLKISWINNWVYLSLKKPIENTCPSYLVFDKTDVEGCLLSVVSCCLWNPSLAPQLCWAGWGGHLSFAAPVNSGQWESLLQAQLSILNSWSVDPVTLLWESAREMHQELACQWRRLRFDPWVQKIPWRRKWLPTPVFLPGEFHGQRSLEVYSPWSPKSQTWLNTHALKGDVRG